MYVVKVNTQSGWRYLYTKRVTLATKEYAHSFRTIWQAEVYVRDSQFATMPWRIVHIDDSAAPKQED